MSYGHGGMPWELNRRVLEAGGRPPVGDARPVAGGGGFEHGLRSGHSCMTLGDNGWKSFLYFSTSELDYESR